MTDPLTPVRRATRKVEARAVALDEATVERDEAIRQAIAQGARTVEVVEVTGLSQQRVSQIKRGVR